MASTPPIESGYGAQGRGCGLPQPRQRKAWAVRPVQEVRTCHYIGAPTSAPRRSPGFLEGTDGVGALHAFGRVICTCTVLRTVVHDDIIEDLSVTWHEQHLGSVVFSHASTMLYLHGASLQQLFTPFILLRAIPRPIYDPAPGADEVLVAVVPNELLAELPLPRLFSILSTRIETC